MNPVRCLLSNGVNTDYKNSDIKEIERKRYSISEYLC